MSCMMKKVILILLGCFPIFCLAQISVEYSDFNVTDDVLLIEEYTYKKVTLKEFNNADTEHKKKYEFKNGLLVKTENKFNPGFGEKTLTSYYEHTKPFQEFTHFDIMGNGERFNMATYTKQNFAGLEFYFPSTDIKVIKNIPNEEYTFNFSDKGGLSSGTHTIKRVDKNVQVTIPSFLGSSTIEFDSKKRPIKDLSSSKTIYTYGKDGLLIGTEQFVGVGSYLDYYFYEKDKYGNWIKKIRTHKEDEIHFVARKLTYKNGETTGNTSYDFAFIKSFIDKMNAGDYAIAQEALEAAMSFTIIQKDKNTIQ